MTKNIENVEIKKDGFSEKELDKIRLPSCMRLFNFLRSQLDTLYRTLISQKVGSRGLENLCIVATSELHHRLQKAEFEASILEGDLEVSSKNWLVHRVNLVKFSDYWVIVDLTASQLPWFKEKTWLIETVLPEEESLKEFLKNNYHWWIKDEQYA